MHQRLPLKSGVSTSTITPGMAARRARIVSAKCPASFVRQFVPRNRSYYDVFEAHLFRRFRHAARLIAIKFQRAPDFDGAKAAIPGANIAEYHKRRRLFRPAFPDIGTASAFAHSMQFRVAHHPVHQLYGVRAWDALFQPFGESCVIHGDWVPCFKRG